MSSGMMAGCKLCYCSGDLVALARPAVVSSTTSAPAARKLGNSCRSFSVQVSSCIVASSTTSFGRQVCHMRVLSPHSGSSSSSSSGVERRGMVSCINVFYGAPNSSKAGVEQRFDFGCTISFTSLSRMATLPPRKKNPSGRLHCRAEARLFDVSEAVSMDATSSSSSSSSPPSLVISNIGQGLPVNLVAGVGISAAVFMMAVLGFMAKPRSDGGSVADLIRRGQLRSDRGGPDSQNLRYDDPFNNPMVKMGKKNPVVRMCGKLFRLTPITLTEEKVLKHQNRRIQAYKWKRPVVFLNEGDPVPKGADPEEVRWIPSNHPFATTSNYIDEDLAQRNVYQTRGVPSRVRAEHEALRKKILEATQGEHEFQFPGMENCGAQAWKTSNENSEDSGSLSTDEAQGSDSTGSFGDGKQGNGSGGVQGRTRNGVSESRSRTIDFSGEEQGLGRS